MVDVDSELTNFRGEARQGNALEPLRSDNSPRAVWGANGSPPGVSADAYVRIGDAVGRLAAGAQAVLDELAGLARAELSAQGVRIEYRGFAAEAGQLDSDDVRGGTAKTMLHRVVIRGDGPDGSLTVRCGWRRGPDVTARLEDLGRLVTGLVDAAAREAAWRELAWRDDLTGLRNRRYFDGALLSLLQRGDGPSGTPRVTVMLFDVDDFKGYNDRFGHHTGDALLRELAQLLRAVTRAADVVARYGGDEFAVIFWDSEAPRVPGSQHPTEPVQLAERFCRVIREHRFECLGPSAPGPVTISGGLAFAPWEGGDPATVMLAADAALRDAKARGKGRIQVAGRCVSHPDK